MPGCRQVAGHRHVRGRGWTLTSVTSPGSPSSEVVRAALLRPDEGEARNRAADNVFTNARHADTPLTGVALTGSMGFVSTFPQQTSLLMGGTCARMCR